MFPLIFFLKSYVHEFDFHSIFISSLFLVMGFYKTGEKWTLIPQQGDWHD